MTAKDDQLKHGMIREAAKYSGVTHGESVRWLSYRQSSNDPGVWYHGGYPGLSMGMDVLPASAIGFTPMQQLLTDMGITGGLYADMIDPAYDPSYVYLTHNRALARDHAAQWSAWNYIKTGQWQSGRLYRVMPNGIIIPNYSRGSVIDICCCLTHGPDTPCSVKVRSACIDYADVEVMPILSGIWGRLYDNLRPVYRQWKKVCDMSKQDGGAVAGPE